MIPILYEKSKKTFTNDYIGILTDVISCVVQESRNDEYELEMQYPVNGSFYADIEQDAIIKAKPNNHDDPQPFRIYRIVKDISGIITVNARHIVYDLSKVTVEPFTSTGTIEDAIDGMIANSVPACGFIFETDKTTSGDYKVSVPTSFRSLMGGMKGSLLDVFGTGEYHYDGYDISLNLNRGTNNGVVIRYGVNMLDLEQEEACDGVYTAVYPFSLNDGVLTTLDEKIISVGGQYPFSRVMSLDLSQEFETAPTKNQLRSKAQQYINENNIGVPDVDLEVRFTKDDESQDINLCDTVTVEFEQYGVSATAKCTTLVYDSIGERVERVRLGSYKYSFLDAIVDELKGKNDDVELDPSMVEHVIEQISLNDEGYVLLHSSQNDGHTDEILVLTGTDKLNLAEKLWRWNRGGLGYSSTGYSGSYGTAITNDGSIVAAYIKTGKLIAIQINGALSAYNHFYVTSDGHMYAKKGVIGSGPAFTFDSTSLYNNNISLINLGVRLQWKTSQSTKYIGFIGKAQYLNATITIPTEHGMDDITNDYPIDMSTAYNISHPSIVLLAGGDADNAGIFYYDPDQNILKNVIRCLKYGSTSIYDQPDYFLTLSLLMFANINMNGNRLTFTRTKAWGPTSYGEESTEPGFSYENYQVNGHSLEYRVGQVFHTGFGVYRRWNRSRWYDDLPNKEIIVGQL